MVVKIKNRFLQSLYNVFYYAIKTANIKEREVLNTKGLHKISLLKFIKAMISIGFGVVSANIISTIVDNAIKGRTEYILNLSVKFLVLIGLYEVSILTLNIVTQRVSEIRCQEFRLGIYDKFLRQAPHEVSDLKAGSLIQSFSDDILEIIRLYRNRCF